MIQATLTKGEMLHELQDILNSFIHEFETIDKKEVNKVPFAGSWTAAQVAEHVNLSASGFADMMQGPTEDTNRPADAMVDQLRSMFGNMEIKMQSPDFVVPEDKQYDKGEKLKQLEDTKDQLFNAAATLDLDKTCTAFALPQMGYLTRRECVAFAAYHTKRHIHQLKKIKAALA